MPNFGVIVIPMLNDNYCYYVYSMGNLNEGFYIDVGDYFKMIKFNSKP